MWQDISEKEKDQYNNLVTHPLQSYEWGEFRKKTGIKVVRRGYLKNGSLKEAFTITIHKIPKTKLTIGYFPKGEAPTVEVLQELKRIGKEQKCVFIQLEPNVVKRQKSEVKIPNLKPSFHPLFTKYTFVLDLTKSEEELLQSFHPKTRYNIKVAQKHNVNVEINNSEKKFNEYLRLTEETTKRQKFYAHTPSYHKLMWETLGTHDSQLKSQNTLSAHLLSADYQKKALVSWVLFVFHDTLYYPYGASSSENRKVMASNLIMWEAIRFGKKLGLSSFDMWGALSENPNKSDPWYGFHKFKEGYGATHTEFIGSFDLVINPALYQVYKVLDKTRWVILRLKKFI